MSSEMGAAPTPGAISGDLATLLLLGIFIAGAAARFSGLDHSLWYDEVITASQVDGTLVDVFTRTAADTYPPAYNLLAWGTRQVMGTGEFSLRLPAAILGSLNILAIYWLANMTAGRTAGLIASAMLAATPFALFYSQEARMYAPMLLAATLYGGATFRLLAVPAWGWAVASILAGVLLLYSHPYGALLWLSIGGASALVVARGGTAIRLGKFVLVQAAIVVPFLPWLAILAGVTGRLVEQGFWIKRPTAFSVWRAFAAVSGGLQGLAVLAIGWGAGWFYWRKAGRQPIADGGMSRRAAVAILLAWVAGPLLLGIGLSLLTTPVFIARYIIGILPALIVLASVGLAGLLASPARLLAGLPVIALVVASANLGPRSGSREDWRGLAAYLKERIETGDCLVLDAGFTEPAFEFYFGTPPSCYVPVNDVASLADLPPDASRLFVVRSHAQLPRATLKKALPKQSWDMTSTAFTGIELREYVRAAADG